MRRRTLLMALPLTAVLASCGVASRAGKGSSAGASSGASSNGGFEVTDIVGRKVTFSAQPQRIVLSESRHVYSLAFLNKTNPIDKVVAWGEDLQKAAPDFYEKVLSVAPKAAELPKIGNIAKDGLPIETLVSHKPDVFIMTLDAYNSAKEKGYLEKLDGQKITYVVTDFRQHPLENTTKSVEMLGTVLGKEDKAKEFTKEWTDKVNTVKERVEKLNDRPSTFVWRAAGLKECCSTVNDSNLGEMINLAGGDNLGDHLVDGASGSVTAEQLIASQPAAIIATGGSWAPDKDKPEVVPHVALGYNSDPETAQKTLQGLLATPGFEELKAPKDDEFFAVWHQFYDSPLNYIAIEQFAKWLHPDEFKDLDPEKDLKEAHKKYVAFDETGVFFVKDDQK